MLLTIISLSTILIDDIYEYTIDEIVDEKWSDGEYNHVFDDMIDYCINTEDLPELNTIISFDTIHKKFIIDIK